MQNKEPTLVRFVLSQPPAASCRHLQPPKPGQKSTQQPHDACSHHAPCQISHTHSRIHRQDDRVKLPSYFDFSPLPQRLLNCSHLEPPRGPKANEILHFVLPLAMDGHVSEAELATPRILSAYPVSLNCPWTALQYTSN